MNDMSAQLPSNKLFSSIGPDYDDRIGTKNAVIYLGRLLPKLASDGPSSQLYSQDMDGEMLS